MVLCDTNIIIELLKGNVKVIDDIEKIGLDKICISAITEMELYFGAFNKSELKFIKKHLHGIPTYHIHSDISIMAVTLTEQYSKSHKLNIPDALIAATAILNNFELFTLNIKDFKYIPNIRLHKKL